MSARRAGRVAYLLVALVSLCGAACTSSTPFTLAASGPFADPAVVHPSLERVAILVTITNRSGDDLNVNPGDFVARDADHRIYAANPTATVADAGLVSGQSARRGTLPLPTVTLRGNDIISGFVVFDVPSGVQPVELIWRQSDTDTVANLSSTR